MGQIDQLLLRIGDDPVRTVDSEEEQGYFLVVFSQYLPSLLYSYCLVDQNW